MGNFGHDDSRVGLEIQFRSRGIYPFVGKRLTPKCPLGYLAQPESTASWDYPAAKFLAACSFYSQDHPNFLDLAPASHSLTFSDRHSSSCKTNRKSRPDMDAPLPRPRLVVQPNYHVLGLIALCAICRNVFFRDICTRFAPHVSALFQVGCVKLHPRAFAGWQQGLDSIKTW
jgi:hypothetical protein